MLTVRYTAYLHFLIPKDVKAILMDYEENDKPSNNGKTGNWWVRWGVFHYINKNGEEKTIEPYHDNDPHDYKYPDEGEDAMEWEDAEEDEEEEETPIISNEPGVFSFTPMILTTADGQKFPFSPANDEEDEEEEEDDSFPACQYCGTTGNTDTCCKFCGVCKKYLKTTKGWTYNEDVGDVCGKCK